jgi:hypothetical protein
MSAIKPENFIKAFQALLDETFDHVHGYYLDPGNSLFETLAGITPEEASIPVGGKCATLAAQVKHVAFYLDVVDRSVREPNSPPADWGEIWRTVSRVTPKEWEDTRNELRASYNRILTLIQDTPNWARDEVIAGAMGILAHTAYHLGEIRQALCTINTNRSSPL